MTPPFLYFPPTGQGVHRQPGLSPLEPSSHFDRRKSSGGEGASRRDGPLARERRGSGVLIRGLLFSRGMLELVRKGWRGIGAAEGL